MTITLLGPQRQRQSVHGAVRDLGVDGPIAVANAGWQERETDDAELNEALSGRSLNLFLYRRWAQVMEQDPGFAQAYDTYTTLAAEQQVLYEIRLHSALETFQVLWRRQVHIPAAHEAALVSALAAIRDVDSWHLYRMGVLQGEFLAEAALDRREVVAAHRVEVAEALQRSVALVIPGGHVGVLLSCLQLFGVDEALALLGGRPIIAWSAGAMALSDTIVLFHDKAPQGYGEPEISQNGLGLFHGLLVFPHGRRRLRLDDPARVAALAGRFPHARCVLLDDGVRVPLAPSGRPTVDLPVLSRTGSLDTWVAR